jgi:fluoride ion exporter CrcB/FEX
VKEALLVAAGGAAGALFRYFIHLLFLRFHGSSLAATLVVNISGSFALGFLVIAWDKLGLSRATSIFGKGERFILRAD